MRTRTWARNSRGTAVSVPAVGPSDLSDRYVTAFAVRSYVSRSSATGFRVHYRASLVANALMIGVSVATLRNWEQGRRVPGVVARALHAHCIEVPAAAASASWCRRHKAVRTDAHDGTRPGCPSRAGHRDAGRRQRDTVPFQAVGLEVIAPWQHPETGAG